MRLVIFVLLLSNSINVSASSLVSQEAEKALRIMTEREKKLELNQQKLQQLKVTPFAKSRKAPDSHLAFGNDYLVCQQGFFSWAYKSTSREYKDCIFRLNIADTDDINKMYATLYRLKKQGWNVERNEVVQQNRVDEKRILNVEHYRFYKEK